MEDSSYNHLFRGDSDKESAGLCQASKKGGESSGERCETGIRQDGKPN